MSNILDKRIIVQLENDLEFGQSLIDEIHQSSTLVKLLNSYKGNFDYDSSLNGAEYTAQNNTITIGNLPSDRILPALAHELGHATGRFYPKDFNFNENTDIKEFLLIFNKTEGEAIYYEYIVSKELGKDFHKKGINVWKYNAEAPEFSIAYRDKIVALIENYEIGSKTEEQLDFLATEIGKINSEMIPTGQDINFPLNYDEDKTFVFLINAFRIIKEDFAELQLGDLYTIPNNRLDYSANSALVKSLTNKTNNFWGNDKDNEIKSVHEGGSLLQRTEKRPDLMYGAGGNDTMIGNSGVDFILGGKGNDYLYGLDGEDRLAGNSGDDHLYGGNGQDRIIGGSGNDHLFAADTKDGDYYEVVSNEKTDRLIPDQDYNDLFGGDGNDHLYGGKGEDYLYGDDYPENIVKSPYVKQYLLNGDDYLQGNAGNDTMDGGNGFDTYHIEDQDTVIDTDMSGKVMFGDHVLGKFILQSPGETDAQK